MMPNTIETMIKRCEFSKEEIITATRGECMWFAVALHDILTERSIKAGLVVASLATSPNDYWLHALVEHRYEYYDIRGKVPAKEIHNEFRTDSMRESSRAKLVARFPRIDSADRIALWNNRLIPHVTSLLMDA